MLTVNSQQLLFLHETDESSERSHVRTQDKDRSSGRFATDQHPPRSPDDAGAVIVHACAKEAASSDCYFHVLAAEIPKVQPKYP